MGKGLALSIVALLMLGFAAVFIGFFLLIAKLAEDHKLANKYRELLEFAAQQAQKPEGWKVTYRERK